MIEITKNVLGKNRQGKLNPPSRPFLIPKEIAGLTVLGLSLTLLGCNRPSSEVTATPPTLGDGLITATPDTGEILIPVTSLIETFRNLDIAVELPNPDWPVSYQQVADILKNDNGKPALTADKITAIIETNQDGSRVWRGWYMAEPPFPLQSGIRFDQDLGYHVDSDNNPVFDPQQIFETDWEKLPEDVRNNFPDLLVDLKIDQPGFALFARRGGITRDGLPQNIHYFAGTEGVEIPAVEQLTLIPVPENLCPEDIEKAALTRAYRQAVLEFRDNPDAQNGIIDVQWFNPETDSFIKVDGRMITELTRQGVDLSILEKLTPGYPVSPEEMSRVIGGRADKWVFEPATGEWFFEAFSYKPGISYKVGVGPVNSQGNLLFGTIQADSRTSQVFNFSSLDVSALSQNMMAPHELMQSDLFARAGGFSTNLEIFNHSWYTWGSGDISLAEKAIEQARLEMVNVGGCPIADLSAILKARVEGLAKDQPDPNVTALFWDGETFIAVSK